MYAFNTIGDMMNHYYGVESVGKADDPVLTTTNGVYNPVFGAMAFSQLNNEANGFGVLPKYPWQKSGWRVITADSGATADGGAAENGALPDTDKPDFAELSTKPKQVIHTFEVSMVQEGLVQKGDDNIGDMEFLRSYFATLHAKRINEQLFVDVDTLAGNGFESLDRVCSSYSEVSDATISLDAGDSDIYGQDRDAAASWADAVVSHASGTDRTLTLEIIRDTLATLESNGARTNLIITGSDTKHKIFGLAETNVRYAGVLEQNQMVKVGINGVETEEGIGYGVRVAMVYGIPMFVSHAVQKDTISRIYLLDTTENEGGIPRLGIALLHPTMYFESGMSAADRNLFSIGTLGTKGAYYTSGELICTFFKAQGKIRDLQ